MYKPVKFLIFDLDGTLINTEKIFLEAYKILLARYGKTFSEDSQRACIGRSKQELHVYLIREYNLDKTVDELAAEGAHIQKELLKHEKIEIMPGAERFVLHMSVNRIPMSIATSSPRNRVGIMTSYHYEFFHLFDHIITAPEVGARSKPHPDIFLISARRFADNPDPSDFLVFEDTPTGVSAAIAAGMQVVMIPHQLIPKEETLQATKVINSFYDFVPEEFGLPPYEDSPEEWQPDDD